MITIAPPLAAFVLLGSAVNPDLTVAAGPNTDLPQAELRDLVNARTTANRP